MLKTSFTRRAHWLVNLVWIITLLSGCGQAASANPPAAEIAPTLQTGIATRPVSSPSAPGPTTTPLPAQSPTASPLTLLISPSLPDGFLERVRLPASIRETDDKTSNNLGLSVTLSYPASEDVTSTTWVYALAAPFPTVLDEISLNDLVSLWKGKAKPALARRLLVSEKTLKVFEQFWGQASPNTVQVVEKTALLETAWKDIPPLQKPTPTVPGRVTPTPQPPSPPTLVIIPFEEIEPRWKVLRVDGQTPLEPGFDAGSYALAARIVLDANPESMPSEAALHALAGSLQLPTNYDPSKLTTLVMTGTTAISRHIGERMEAKGLTYPGEAIRAWLADADLTHISNEVSFYPACPKPGPDRADMRFCSSPKYITLLEYIGADIIELTGNHGLDWGFQPFIDTLAMYRQRGWKTYGGGANLEEAKKPLLVENKGNRLAFIGCSPSGPAAVWATQNTPGSAPCDLNKLEQQVRKLRADGYLPIVTFQAMESDTYQPAVGQGTPDFRRMARAGAVIVSGSQSHVPQTMTFVDGNFVHYGLGNLFFDQMEQTRTRQEFIDRHVFYNGKYLGVELLSALLEDYARPRPMTPAEREKFLKKIFSLSNWSVAN